MNESMDVCKYVFVYMYINVCMHGEKQRLKRRLKVNKNEILLRYRDIQSDIQTDKQTGKRADRLTQYL